MTDISLEYYWTAPKYEKEYEELQLQEKQAKIEEEKRRNKKRDNKPNV